MIYIQNWNLCGTLFVANKKIHFIATDGYTWIKMSGTVMESQVIFKRTTSKEQIHFRMIASLWKIKMKPTILWCIFRICNGCFFSTKSLARGNQNICFFVNVRINYKWYAWNDKNPIIIIGSEKKKNKFDLKFDQSCGENTKKNWT